ncbi:hypothetical protein GCM10010103_69800 [Streptomyces paradoxus]
MGTPTGHTFAQVSDREQGIFRFRALRAPPGPFDKMSISTVKGISVVSAPFGDAHFTEARGPSETIEPPPAQQLTPPAAS